MSKSLAIKYRPQDWDSVTEQGSIKTILTQQIESGDIRNAYLFAGGAGTGKTTCARIFANEVNDGNGDPIEMDAASHNSVDDVREISKMAQTGSMTCKYKVFLIDECHSLSNQAWQAMLKLIEEPPARSIFIFCTTDPQKIPATIISRVQRYQFQRISQDGIVNRLLEIITMENSEAANIQATRSAVEYIAKLACGGMRDAITMLDKCLAYSTDLTMENILQALNITGYDDYMKLTEHLMYKEYKELIVLLDEIYASGVDLKLFIRNYLTFILDVNKYIVLESPGEAFKHINIPHTKEMQKWLEDWMRDDDYLPTFNDLLDALVKLDADIKWSQNVKADVEAALLLF